MADDAAGGRSTRQRRRPRTSFGAVDGRARSRRSWRCGTRAGCVAASCSDARAAAAATPFVRRPRGRVGAGRAREGAAGGEAMWGMVPYTFDASTPRERIAQDLAMRMRSAVSSTSFAPARRGEGVGGRAGQAGRHGRADARAHGETDQLVPPENGRVLARAIPDARLVMLPDARGQFLTDQLEPARRTRCWRSWIGRSRTPPASRACQRTQTVYRGERRASRRIFQDLPFALCSGLGG